MNKYYNELYLIKRRGPLFLEGGAGFKIIETIIIINAIKLNTNLSKLSFMKQLFRV